MRKEDTEIHYRPEVADHLRIAASTAIKLYKQDPRTILYHLCAKHYNREEHKEKRDVMDAAAKQYADDLSRHESANLLVVQFDKHFTDDDLYNELHPDRLTEASAARLISEPIQNLILAIKEKIDMSDFTKAEKYAVDSFFSMLLAPTRNPNIQIHEGCKKCYYDEHLWERGYRKDTDSTIQYIENELDNRLYFFETPDEELTLDSSDEKTNEEELNK